MWVRSLGQEDPLEKEMATHCHVPTCGSVTVKGTFLLASLLGHSFASSLPALVEMRALLCGVVIIK